MISLDTLGTIELRGPTGSELRSVLTQPKRLALTCYLAIESSRGFQRRDWLLGLFWPELGQSQARQALRQSLYFLRHALGEPVVVSRGACEIGIAQDTIGCDVRTFTQAYADFAESLATEFAAEPSAETKALIRAVRSRTEVPFTAVSG